MPKYILPLVFSLGPGVGKGATQNVVGKAGERVVQDERISEGDAKPGWEAAAG